MLTVFLSATYFTIEAQVVLPESSITYNRLGEQINKSNFTYDSKGRVIKDLGEAWEKSSGMWINNYLNITEYDANDNIIAEENYYWDINQQLWIGSSKYRSEFDNNGKQTFNIIFNWDEETNDWINDSQYIYEYDQEGRFIRQESYMWDSMSGIWKGISKSVNTFDNYGNIVFYESSMWNDETNNWRVMSKNINDYLDDGTQIFNEYYQLNYETEELELLDRTVSTLNEMGKIDYSITTIADDSEGGMVNSIRKTYLYDTDGNLLGTQNDSWDKGLENWTPADKQEITSVGVNRTEKIDSYWDQTLSDWAYRTKYVEIYDNAGNRIRRTTYNWNNSQNDWINYVDIIDEYDEKNNKILNESYTWDGSRWKGTSKSIEAYDSNNMRILYERYKWNVSSWNWIGEVRNLNSYDSNKNQLMYANYRWNTVTNNWEGVSKGVTEYNELNQRTSFFSYIWNATEQDWYANTHLQFSYDSFGNLQTFLSSSWNISLNEWKETNKIINEYNEDGQPLRSESYLPNSDTSELELNQYTIYNYPELGLDTYTLTFEAAGNEKIITLTSNTNWIVTSDASWLTVTPISGNGDTRLAVTAVRNPQNKTRNAVFTVQAGNIIQTVAITQNGASITPPDPHFYTVNVLPVVGASTTPLNGRYSVEEYDSFTLDIFVDYDYDASEIGLRIDNDTIRNLSTLGNNLSFTHTVHSIINDIELEVIGLKYIDPVNNESLLGSTRVYTIDRVVYIETDNSNKVQVFSIDGKLYTQQYIHAGTTSILLKEGIYVILLQGKSYKVIVN